MQAAADANTTAASQAAALHIYFLTLALWEAPWGFCNAENGLVTALSHNYNEYCPAVPVHLTCAYF